MLRLLPYDANNIIGERRREAWSATCADHQRRNYETDPIPRALNGHRRLMTLDTTHVPGSTRDLLRYVRCTRWSRASHRSCIIRERQAHLGPFLLRFDLRWRRAADSDAGCRVLVRTLIVVLATATANGSSLPLGRSSPGRVRRARRKRERPFLFRVGLLVLRSGVLGVSRRGRCCRRIRKWGKALCFGVMKLERNKKE